MDVQSQKRARMRELHAKGLSCRRIAEQLGVSKSTVSKWAKEDGLSFNREQTAAAVQAGMVDLAARRQRLLDSMLTTVEQAIANLEPAVSRDVRDVLTSAAIVYDKATAALDNTPEAAKSEAALATLTAQLQPHKPG